MVDTVTELVDRAQIKDLLSRFTALMDDHQLTKENLRGIFTKDALLHFASWGAQGIDEIQRLGKKVLPEVTQSEQSTSDRLVHFAGEKMAILRANLHARYEFSNSKVLGVARMAVDGVFDCSVIKTAHGWRFSGLTLRGVKADR